MDTLKASPGRVLAFISRCTAWLTPTRRRAVYAAIPLVAGVLVALGFVTADEATKWVAVAYAAGGLASGVMASVKARRADFKALYTLLTGCAVALVALGAITQAQADSILGVAWKVAVAAPAVIAVFRTDPSTPTGEPADEYLPAHAA